jgi:hypothetical protein
MEAVGGVPAIVLAVDHPDPKADGLQQVAVAPITHSPPHDPNVAVEIPLRVKERLDLDSERSFPVSSAGCRLP